MVHVLETGEGTYSNPAVLCAGRPDQCRRRCAGIGQPGLACGPSSVPGYRANGWVCRTCSVVVRAVKLRLSGKIDDLE